MGSGIPFPNNWVYLETELTWLERLLLVAVAQQRKTLKSVTRVAKTSSDKATSDWWQGLITVKNRTYDDIALKPAERPSLGYQQVLDQRIRLSQAGQVSLGLPTMQTVLGMSLFEKKLVLMALAPEVQVRYGRLYHYLQTGAHCAAGALPTVELALRMLCRNDMERRRARTQLSGANSLLQRQILCRVEGAPTLLGSQLRLASDWVDYLLAETPDPAWPLQWLMATRFVQRVPVLSSEVVLADGLKPQLQAVAAKPRSRLLLVGEKGTGKQEVAIALANQLQQPLHSLDLAQIPPQDWPACLTELDQANYPIVLIKSAHRWLGRTSAIDCAALQQWLTQSAAHVIFLVHHRHLVRRHWRQQLTVIDIPMPEADLRLRLWHQAFAGGVKGMGKVRWTTLAEGLALSKADIMDIATLAQALAGPDETALTHLQQALIQQGYSWQLR
ncbi:MAG: hypothetical protein AAF282_11175 [Cyanobacteria bacterium P01_A01_bin.15]